MHLTAKTHSANIIPRTRKPTSRKRSTTNKMTDILPQMRQILKSGPITQKAQYNLTLSTTGLATSTKVNTHYLPGLSPPNSTLLPQMAALRRNDHRSETLTHPHANNFPLPSATRVPQPSRNPPRRRSSPLLRRVHHVSAGPDSSRAEFLDFFWDEQVAECGLLQAREGGGCAGHGVRGVYLR